LPGKEAVVFLPSQFLPNPHDPFQPPDLRRQRILYLVEHGRPPSRAHDDTPTWRAWRFYAGLKGCQDDADRQRLAQVYADVAEADFFFNTAAPLRRAELEARLLGGGPDDEVAAKMGLTPAAVGVYHDLFFDVRSGLTASTWVTNTVFGPKVHFGLTPDDHELLVKVVGYGYGAQGVDDYLDYLREPPVVPADLGGLDAVQLKALGTKLRTRIWVLSMATPASAARPETWQWIQRRLAEAFGQRAAEGERAVLGSLRPVLDVMDAAARGEIVRPVWAEAVPA
jgi:hypothetical protein